MVQSLGLPIAALSDLPPQKKLNALGLEAMFEIISCSEDWGVIKPHPKAFYGVSAALGVDPSSVLYVGNSTTYDVKGAHAVGMLTARRGSSCSLADFSFRRWEELAAWLRCQIE